MEVMKTINFKVAGVNLSCNLPETWLNEKIFAKKDLGETLSAIRKTWEKAKLSVDKKEVLQSCVNSIEDLFRQQKEIFDEKLPERAYIERLLTDFQENTQRMLERIACDRNELKSLFLNEVNNDKQIKLCGIQSMGSDFHHHGRQVHSLEFSCNSSTYSERLQNKQETVKPVKVIYKPFPIMADAMLFGDIERLAQVDAQFANEHSFAEIVNQALIKDNKEPLKTYLVWPREDVNSEEKIGKHYGYIGSLLYYYQQQQNVCIWQKQETVKLKLLSKMNYFPTEATIHLLTIDGFTMARRIVASTNLTSNEAQENLRSNQYFMITPLEWLRSRLQAFAFNEQMRETLLNNIKYSLKSIRMNKVGIPVDLSETQVIERDCMTLAEITSSILTEEELNSFPSLEKSNPNSLNFNSLLEIVLMADNLEDSSYKLDVPAKEEAKETANKRLLGAMTFFAEKNIAYQNSTVSDEFSSEDKEQDDLPLNRPYKKHS